MVETRLLRVRGGMHILEYDFVSQGFKIRGLCLPAVERFASMGDRVAYETQRVEQWADPIPLGQVSEDGFTVIMGHEVHVDMQLFQVREGVVYISKPVRDIAHDDELRDLVHPLDRRPYHTLRIASKWVVDSLG